ncbi:MAG TPA: hypothetical protein VKH37_04030, partial [Ferruginibacter sp.]|nr:hypothetical protein [Ferruginibacter sp.]
IFALSKILFGFNKGWGGGGRGRWGRRMDQKWNNMSPEEREKFREKWNRHCGKWGRQTDIGSDNAASA